MSRQQAMSRLVGTALRSMKGRELVRKRPQLLLSLALSRLRKKNHRDGLRPLWPFACLNRLSPCAPFFRDVFLPGLGPLQSNDREISQRTRITPKTSLQCAHGRRTQKILLKKTKSHQTRQQRRRQRRRLRRRLLHHSRLASPPRRAAVRPLTRSRPSPWGASGLCGPSKPLWSV